ncbi:Pycsar system effector family protein [Phenylobacterium sp.]|uniref:Pycsar system effector family protein n=1 Tax=Phenylobacterium sp. TaxID=1871053 RepID=UPI00271FDBA6|nr:Pycsar system effector family protein [Phenylobacterium sp.]MDO8802548.1 DUF5706 domain-containing protein [Phenylobacterium sp.]
MCVAFLFTWRCCTVAAKEGGIMQNPMSFATAQLDRLQTFFPRVEGKASFLLAINLALLTSIAVNMPVRNLDSPRGVLGSIASILLSFSLWHVYQTFFPHLKGASKVSVFYFRDIARLSPEQYMNRLNLVTDQELLDDLHCQIWRNSEILDLKFSSVETAFRFLALSVIPWFGFLAAISLRLGRFPDLGIST